MTVILMNERRGIRFEVPIDPPPSSRRAANVLARSNRDPPPSFHEELWKRLNAERCSNRLCGRVIATRVVTGQVGHLFTRVPDNGDVPLFPYVGYDA